MITKRTANALCELIDYIKEQVKRDDRRLNAYAWITRESDGCGFAACAAGFQCMKDGVNPANVNSYGVFIKDEKPWNVQRYAINALGLTTVQANALFYTGNWDNDLRGLYHKGYPVEAFASAIYRFIEVEGVGE